VCSNVTLKEPRSGEAFAAEVALAALVVRPQVHGVGRHGDVGLAAVRTLSGFLVLEGSKKRKGHEMFL